MRPVQVARLDERQPRYKCSVGEHVRNVRKVKALSQRVSPKEAVVWIGYCYILLIMKFLNSLFVWGSV